MKSEQYLFELGAVALACILQQQHDEPTMIANALDSFDWKSVERRIPECDIKSWNQIKKHLKS